MEVAEGVRQLVDEQEVAEVVAGEVAVELDADDGRARRDGADVDEVRRDGDVKGCAATAR